MPQSLSKLSPGPLVLGAMILAAVATRLLYHFNPGLVPPNFSPVEAVALFGGAYFADRRLALLVPLAAMAVSDLIIGFHGLLWLVYACVALSTVLGFGLRGKVRPVRVAAYGVLGSTLFFVFTNFGVWLGSSMYPQTWAGLVECYVAGIPFYKNTLAGTLFYSAVLFGGFALLRQRLPQLRAQTV
ncbi:MAG: hypothetical protein LKM39_00590 [Chiayiivirga sp.]|jgi:hypothetical protein|nr:hypothetical protein [Chiayiivirga sp.]